MIVCDVETNNILDRQLSHAEAIKKMQFSIAVTYNDETDEWRQWTLSILPDLWEYLKTDLVAGFNFVDFDLPVIMYSLWRMGEECDGQLRTHDLFAVIREKTGRWYSVNSLSIANLGRSKSGNGLEVAGWLAEYEHTADPELLKKSFAYCCDDVDLEYSLYRILLGGAPLILPPIPKKNLMESLKFYLDGRIENV